MIIKLYFLYKEIKKLSKLSKLLVTLIVYIFLKFIKTPEIFLYDECACYLFHITPRYIVPNQVA